MPIVKFVMGPAIEDFVRTHYENPHKILNKLHKDSGKRIEIDSIFGWILEAYHYEEYADKNAAYGLDPKIVFRIDSKSFKDSLPELASQYIQNKWMHSSKATTYLCKAILEAEAYPLSRELRNAFERKGGFFFLGSLARLLREGKRAHMFWLLGLDFALAYFLGATLSILLLVLSIIRVLYYKHKFSKLLVKLLYVIDQISSYSYNPKHIIELLKAAEKDGLYVSSILFSLLELQDEK